MATGASPVLHGARTGAGGGWEAPGLSGAGGPGAGRCRTMLPEQPLPPLVPPSGCCCYAVGCDRVWLILPFTKLPVIIHGLLWFGESRHSED